MVKKYDAILFDLDDTLIDNDESIKYAIFKVFEIFGISCNDNNFSRWKMFDTYYWHEWESGNMIIPDEMSSLEDRINYLRANRFTRFFKEYNLSFEDSLDINNYYISLLAKNIVLLDGALDIVSDLSKTHEIIIATNGPKDAACEKVKVANLECYIKAIVASGECGFSKPMTGFYDYCISKMDVKDKEKMLMVGDSLTTDMMGGYNNGIDTCWFNRHNYINHTKISPTYEIKYLKELKKRN